MIVIGGSLSIIYACEWDPIAARNENMAETNDKQDVAVYLERDILGCIINNNENVDNNNTYARIIRDYCSIRAEIDE